MNELPPRCWYALIQLVPDLSREEGLNVGMVAVREPRELAVRTLDEGGLREVRRRLGMIEENPRVDRGVRAFARRLGALEDATPEGLRGFAWSEAGELCLRAPHAVRSGSPEETLDRLFPLLVEPVRSRAARPEDGNNRGE